MCCSVQDLQEQEAGGRNGASHLQYVRKDNACDSLRQDVQQSQTGRVKVLKTYSGRQL